MHSTPSASVVATPVTTSALPLAADETLDQGLDELIRAAARRALAAALETEVSQYIAAHAHLRDERGRRLVSRNGRLPRRVVQSSLGPLEVHQPRISDRRKDESGQRIRFTSRVLPKYLRKTKAVEELVPWLYLKGVSSNDFSEALSALGLDGAAGFSPNSVGRMKEHWRQEWFEWSRRSLAGKRYAYLWADGIYFNIRLGDAGRQCVLVLMGANEEGGKELVALTDGHRESTQSWLEVLRELKERGLECSPRLAVGDGSLGFWKALAEVYPDCRQQRCWVHKTANVLAHLPRTRQSSAKADLHQVWMAGTAAEAGAAFDSFLRIYRTQFPKAVACLEKDREELLAFYRFPAEHWPHVRTTNPIESTFATVRLRTAKTKGSGTREACLSLAFKLCQSAQKKWRPLNAPGLVADVDAGVEFEDGTRKAA